MQWEGFKHCCGAAEFGGFPYPGQGVAKTQFLKQLRDVCSRIRLDYKGLAICTLDSEQNKLWGKVLISEGFEQIASYINPNTGNRVRAYVKDLTKKLRRG